MMYYIMRLLGGKIVVTKFYLCVLVACIITILICIIRNRKVDALFMFFTILVTCNNLGRYIIAISTNKDMALLGNKFL